MPLLKISHAIVDVASEVSGRTGTGGLWREALLAQKVLSGVTRGTSIIRNCAAFPNCPIHRRIATYLAAVREEAVQRGYNFDAAKIGRRRVRGKMKETRGQLLYEWRHLKRKLKTRDVKRYRELLPVKSPRRIRCSGLFPARCGIGKRCVESVIRRVGGPYLFN